MSIALEDTATLKAWYEEFDKPDNQERYTLPGVPYGFFQIQRELVRRDRIEGIMEDLGK
jgi:hypothetical protein